MQTGPLPNSLQWSRKVFNMSDSTSEESAEQIGEWLAVLIDPDSTVELRILFEGKPPIVRH